MHIRINDRFRPFTKSEGSFLILPKTRFALQIYPAKIIFFDLSENTKLLLEVYLDFDGLASKFMAECDLEKEQILVYIETDAKELIRYRIYNENEKINLSFTHKPKNFKCSNEGELPIALNNLKKTVFKERISFGVFKKQNFENVMERLSLKEFLPFWFFLGQMTPACNPMEEKDSLFFEMEEAKMSEAKPIIASLLKKIAKLGFKGILTPDLKNPKFLGASPKIISSASDIDLLKKGYEFIKSLFISEEENTLFFLPYLLKELESGRAQFMQKAGLFEIEWRKHRLKKLIFHSLQDQELNFYFNTPVASCRISDKPNNFIFCKDFIKIKFEGNKSYYFDNFI